jgi:hypothetical protein
MRVEGILKRVIDCKTEGRRTGRLKLRWIVGALEDIKKLGVKNWWTAARDWEAEAHTGL